ncbi:MAG: succinate dehydrogenase assembly factor 2 [Proteobacteria bacterium]|nr:succinate dehydrogenase assembly factor 2 [Pseudomonadota bacterium]
MTEETNARLKRLLFRSWHRGTREMDLLLGNFARRHLESFTEDQLDRFEALIELGDPELFAWISGLESVPPGLDNDVMSLLKDFKFRSISD